MCVHCEGGNRREESGPTEVGGTEKDAGTGGEEFSEDGDEGEPSGAEGEQAGRCDGTEGSDMVAEERRVQNDLKTGERSAQFSK